MASRMKRMFHRKKEDDNAYPAEHGMASVKSDPTLRTSLYQSSMAGVTPQMGNHPVKGNDSSVLLHQPRKSSVRSRRSSGSHYNEPNSSRTPDTYATGGRRVLTKTPPPKNAASPETSYAPYQQQTPTPATRQEERKKRWSRTPLPEDLANLNLGNGGPTTVTQTVTTTQFGNTPNGPRNAPQAPAQSSSNGPTIRTVTQNSNLQPSAAQNIHPQSSAPRSQRQQLAPAAVADNHVKPIRQQMGDEGPAQHSTPQSFVSRSQQQQRMPAANAEAYSKLNRQEVDDASPAQDTKRQSYTSRPQRQQQVPGAFPETPVLPNRESGVFSDTPMVSKRQSGAFPESQVTANRQSMDGSAPSPQVSIPRKQVGAPAPSSYASAPATAPQTTRSKGHGRYNDGERGLPSATASAYTRNDNSRSRDQDATPLSSRPNKTIAQGATSPRDAQDVVDRAKTNTYDTQVVETVAPAVVHETIQKKAHHVREEHVTREIYNHDVYHRVLPVIDVEVLPPRHFLPVEGGGLVEIGAQEVPGRGDNWVIAETASKIPSDQAAPQGPRQFSARKFLGTDGDAMKYIAAEGHEKTEQTWVHPPVMETGARDTGQSWPFVFGSETPEKGTYGYTSPSAKKRSSKRHSAGQSSASQLNRAGRVT